MGWAGTHAGRRKSFSTEVKSRILSKSKSLCACCGQALSLDSMTVEHVVPISRGGSNDLVNLVALCFQCNQSKRDLICVPQSNFSHLSQTHLNETAEYFYSWFKDIQHNFDLQAYPLITQSALIPVKKAIGCKDFVIGYTTLQYCNKALRAEVEAVTEVKLDETPYYILKSNKTDKLLTLLRVNVDALTINICCEWTCQQLNVVAALMSSVVRALLETYEALKIPIFAINYAAHDSKFFSTAYSYRNYFERWGQSFNEIHERTGRNFSGVNLRLRYSVFKEA